MKLVLPLWAPLSWETWGTEIGIFGCFVSGLLKLHLCLLFFQHVESKSPWIRGTLFIQSDFPLLFSVFLTCHIANLLIYLHLLPFFCGNPTFCSLRSWWFRWSTVWLKHTCSYEEISLFCIYLVHHFSLVIRVLCMSYGFGVIICAFMTLTALFPSCVCPSIRLSKIIPLRSCVKIGKIRI